MENEEILKSLAELETNLQTIKSARQQVEDIIASFQEIGRTAEEYSNALRGISTSLEEIIAGLNSIDTDVILQDLSGVSEKVDRIDSESKEFESRLNNELSHIKSVPSEAISGVSERIDRIDSENKEFESRLNNELSHIKSVLSEAISGVSEKVDRIDSENKEFEIRLNNELSHIKSDLKKNRLFTIASAVVIVILLILLLVR